MASSDVQRKLTAILCADVVRYSRSIGRFTERVFSARSKGWTIPLVMLLFALVSGNLSAGVTDCTTVKNGVAKVVSFSTKGKDGRAVSVQGIVIKPAGHGPFPALVVLHGDGGIYPPRCYNPSLRPFVNLGYAVLLIDSATPRLGQLPGYSFEDQAQDAHKGKDLLANLPIVDAERIGVVGWSRGGAAVLSSVTRPKSFKRARAFPFKVAVAVYPMCYAEVVLEAPLLILHGGKDVITSAANCSRMKIIGSQRHDFVLRIYPDAGHLFDTSSHYNESAAMDAHATMKDFLARHLQ